MIIKTVLSKTPSKNNITQKIKIEISLCHNDLVVCNKIIAINQVGHMILTTKNQPRKKWWGS